MTRDLSFLEFKDTDTPELRELKVYWQHMMSLPETERRYYLQVEAVQSEEHWLNFMVASRKELGYTIQDIRRQRERVQWQKKQLSQMEKPSIKPRQS